jgi:hypothetical protein
MAAGGWLGLGSALRGGRELAGGLAEDIETRRQKKKEEEAAAAKAEGLRGLGEKVLGGASPRELAGEALGLGETGLSMQWGTQAFSAEDREAQARRAAEAAEKEAQDKAGDLRFSLEQKLESLETSIGEDADFLRSPEGKAYLAAKDNINTAEDEKAAQAASKDAIDLYNKYLDEKQKQELKKEEEKEKKSGTKRMTAESSSKLGLLRNGYDALQTLRSIIASPGFDAIDLSDVGRIKNREVKALMNRISEAIARPHTGAAINEGEKKTFLQMMPRAADYLDSSVMEKKMNAIEDEFVTTIEGIVNQSYKKYLSEISKEGRRLNPAENRYIGGEQKPAQPQSKAPQPNGKATFQGQFDDLWGDE